MTILISDNNNKLENSYKENGIIYNNSKINYNIKYLPLDTWKLSNKQILNAYNNSVFL